jgi:hypothetical protein
VTQVGDRQKSNLTAEDHFEGDGSQCGQTAATVPHITDQSIIHHLRGISWNWG